MRRYLRAFALVGLCPFLPAFAGDTLEQMFRIPPDSARPGVNGLSSRQQDIAWMDGVERRVEQRDEMPLCRT